MLVIDRKLLIFFQDKNADIKGKIEIGINSVDIPQREGKVIN